MDGTTVSALNGLALGLASTVHCAGMCGAISCSLLWHTDKAPLGTALYSFSATHLGRVLAYAVAGAAVGALGTPAIAWLDRDAAFRILQWGGATALVWIGLSTAGLLPSITLLDRAMSLTANRVVRLGGRASSAAVAPLFAGFTWGLMPCAMVYGALFLAMLTGSPLAGALVMASFGIGTLPGLVATSLGARAFSTAARSRAGRAVAGLAIASFGILSVLIAPHGAGVICVTENARAVSSASQ